MKPFLRRPAHPGKMIKTHYLEPLKISVSTAAKALCISRKTLSKIINGHGPVTTDMALRLAKTFCTSPELWLNLQRNYDLWHLAHESKAWKNAKVLLTAKHLLAHA